MRAIDDAVRLSVCIIEVWEGLRAPKRRVGSCMRSVGSDRWRKRGRGEETRRNGPLKGPYPAYG